MNNEDFKNKIWEIINTFPKQSVAKIKRDLSLWDWILNNCDPIADSPSTKIYTALTNEKQTCKCGSGKLRKLKSLKDGFRFCGKAATCKLAADSVSKHCKESAKLWDKTAAKEKRAITNKNKYGVENAGQTSTAIAHHKDFYTDKEKVANNLEKI